MAVLTAAAEAAGLASPSNPALAQLDHLLGPGTAEGIAATGPIPYNAPGMVGMPVGMGLAGMQGGLAGMQGGLAGMQGGLAGMGGMRGFLRATADLPPTMMEAVLGTVLGAWGGGAGAPGSSGAAADPGAPSSNELLGEDYEDSKVRGHTLRVRGCCVGAHSG
jgi:hypothetical protein